MQVIYRLPAIFADIDDDAEAVVGEAEDS